MADDEMVYPSSAFRRSKRARLVEDPAAGATLKAGASPAPAYTPLATAMGLRLAGGKEDGGEEDAEEHLGEEDLEEFGGEEDAEEYGSEEGGSEEDCGEDDAEERGGEEGCGDGDYGEEDYAEDDYAEEDGGEGDLDEHGEEVDVETLLQLCEPNRDVCAPCDLPCCKPALFANFRRVVSRV